MALHHAHRKWFADVYCATIHTHTNKFEVIIDVEKTYSVSQGDYASKFVHATPKNLQGRIFERN
jgi:hypothetical protein